MLSAAFIQKDNRALTDRSNIRREELRFYYGLADIGRPKLIIPQSMSGSDTEGTMWELSNYISFKKAAYEIPLRGKFWWNVTGPDGYYGIALAANYKKCRELVELLEPLEYGGLICSDTFYKIWSEAERNNWGEVKSRFSREVEDRTGVHLDSSKEAVLKTLLHELMDRVDIGFEMSPGSSLSLDLDVLLAACDRQIVMETYLKLAQ